MELLLLRIYKSIEEWQEYDSFPRITIIIDWSHWRCHEDTARSYSSVLRAHSHKIFESSWPPKMREITLWSSTNGAIPYFLVVPGSELSITEIAEYECFSPL